MSFAMGGTPGYLERFIHTVDEWASGAERLGTLASHDRTHWFVG